MKKIINNLSKRVISLILVSVMIAGCFGTLTFTSAAATQYKPYYDQGFSVKSNGNGSFTISRTDKSEYAKVYYRTLSGSAIAGVHFTAKGDYLEFFAGQDSKDVQINETYVGSISEAIDKYQVNNRTYTLEVVNQYGDRLASCDRTLSYTSSYMLSKTLYGEKSVTVFSGEKTVTDSGYGQKGMPYTASIESYMTSSDVKPEYFSAVGAEVRMRLNFSVKEVNDGYQHLQILFDELGNFDTQNSNGNPGTINYAAYLAAFAHYAGTEYTSYEDYTFPVTSADNNCSDVDPAWNYSPYNNKYGKLYTQKFNNNRATDGRIVVPTDAKTVVLRFDAAGNWDDDWKVKDAVAYLQATDDNKPTVTGVYATGATYRRTHFLRLSIRFSETVKVGTATPVLKTNFGNLTYKGGAGTNVLYFEGTVQSENSGLAINGMTNASSITDYAGNAYTYASITAPQNVQGTTSSTVTFDGGEVESSRFQYVASTGSATNKTITLPGGNIFSGIPYYIDELDYYTTDNDTTHYKPGDTYKVLGSMTFTAHWKYKKYDITFKNDDGTELTTIQVTYGETPEYNGETPEKEPDQQYNYTFFKWTPDITRVTGNATYTATYASHLNKYTVTFKNWDGTELQSDLLEYGSTPEYDGATPTKDADVDKTYAFSGWDKTIDTVTEDTVYTAQFTSTVRSYKITFKNEDGTVIRSGDWEYGTVPFCRAPSKTPTNTEVYAFDHWTTDPSVGSDDITFVTGDATYYAVYTSETRYYIVIFKNQDGSVLQVSSYEYGQTPVYNGETPSLEDEGTISYTFKNWNKEITPVTCNETYTAEYYVNTSGTSGGIKWSLYCDTLTISKPENQSGNMLDYGRETSVPWFVHRSQIVHLIVEDGVIKIGKNAFYELQNLKDAAIPTSVTKIGNNAFYRCSSLQSIKIPYGVTYIGTYAFYDDDSLTSVFIPGTVEYVGLYAFCSCENLESVTIADGVSEIETEAFSDCSSLKNITIPGSVESIGYRAFSCCTSLETAVIKYGVKTIDDNVFENCCSLESVVIADSVTSIGEDVFNCCGSLISVTLPSGIDTIKPGTFYDCAALESIVIPEGVKIIAQNAFNCCSSLSEITLPSTLETIDSGAFSYCSGSLTVYYNGSRSMWNVIYVACNSSSGLSQLSLSVIYTGTTVSTQTPDCIEAELDRYFVSGDDTNRTVTVSVKTAQGCTSYGITVTYDDENDHNQTLLLTQKSENVYTFDVPAGVDVDVWVETDSVESTVLHMGENKLYLTGRDKIYTFTPDEEGWYTFKAPDEKEIYLRVTNEEQTLLSRIFYIGKDTESYVYLAAGRTYTAAISNNDSERGSHVGSVLIEKTSQLYKISVAAENGAIAVTSVEGLPITEAPYYALVLITPYPAEGYLYDDSKDEFGIIKYGNDTTSAGYYSAYYDENNVCHYTDYLFYMPASPVTVSFDFLEPSIRLVADENCIGLSINGAYYTRQQLSDLYISPQTTINIDYIIPICYIDYDYTSVIITKEDGTVFNGCLMPDGVLTVTVTTSPRDLILIEQLNTAYDVTAYTQYFKFIPSQDGLYNVSVTAGNFIVFTRDGNQLSPESERIYQMTEGQIYAGYIVGGSGGTITVEKTGDYTAPEPLPVINVEGGSYTVDHYNSDTVLTAIPAAGYRFLYWDIEYEDGVTDHYPYSEFSYNEYSEIASFSLVFERIKYDIVFANADGTVLQHTKQYYGDIPEYNGTPAITHDAMTYTFNGWDSEITEVTGNKVYIATYDVTYDPVLVKGDNHVIADTDYTEYTFTPAESGWYKFSCTGTVKMLIADGDTTLVSLNGSNVNRDVYLNKDKTYSIKIMLSNGSSAFISVLSITDSETNKINVKTEHGTVIFTTAWGDIVTEAPFRAVITAAPYPENGYTRFSPTLGYRTGTSTATRNCQKRNNGEFYFSMPDDFVTFVPVFEEKYTVTFEHDDGCYALRINGNLFYTTNEELSALDIKNGHEIDIQPMLYNDRELVSFAVYDKDGNKLTNDNDTYFYVDINGATLQNSDFRVIVTTKKAAYTDMVLNTEYTVTETTRFSFTPPEDGFYDFGSIDTCRGFDLIDYNPFGHDILTYDILGNVGLETPFNGYGLYANQTYYFEVSEGTVKPIKVDTNVKMPTVNLQNAEHGSASYAAYGVYGVGIIDLVANADPGYRLAEWQISYENGEDGYSVENNPAFYNIFKIDRGAVTVTPVFEKVTYTVIFADGNGNLLQIGEYEYGETPVYNGGEIPAKTANGVTYTSNGWGRELTPVTEDRVYVASFDMTYDPALRVGDNYVILDKTDTEYTFQPSESGWYEFTASDYMHVIFTDGENDLLNAYASLLSKNFYLNKDKTYSVKVAGRDTEAFHTALLRIAVPETYKLNVECEHGTILFTTEDGDAVTEAPYGTYVNGRLYPDNGYWYFATGGNSRIKYRMEGPGSGSVEVNNNQFHIYVARNDCTFMPVFEEKYNIIFDHDEGCTALYIDGEYYASNEELRNLNIKNGSLLEIHLLGYRDYAVTFFAVYDKHGNKLTNGNDASFSYSEYYSTYKKTIPDGVLRVVARTENVSSSAVEMTLDTEYTGTGDKWFKFTPDENGFYKFLVNGNACIVADRLNYVAIPPIYDYIFVEGIEATTAYYGLFAGQTYYIPDPEGTVKVIKVDSDKEMPAVTVANAEHGSVSYVGSMDFLHLFAYPDAGYRFVKWEITYKNSNRVDYETASPALSAGYELNCGDVTITPVYEKITYTVIFTDENGNILQIGEYGYGDTPVYGGKTPAKADAANATYGFAGWNSEITAVTENKVYRPVFTAENISDTLSIGDNCVICEKNTEKTYTFTPDKDGWYGFSWTNAIDSCYMFYDGQELIEEIIPGWNGTDFDKYYYLTGGKTYTVVNVSYGDTHTGVLTITTDLKVYKITGAVSGEGLLAVTDLSGKVVAEAPAGADLNVWMYPEKGHTLYSFSTDPNINCNYDPDNKRLDVIMPASELQVSVSYKKQGDPKYLKVTGDAGCYRFMAGSDYYHFGDTVQIDELQYVIIETYSYYEIDSVTVKDMANGDDLEFTLHDITILLPDHDGSIVITVTTKPRSEPLLSLGETQIDDYSARFRFIPEQSGYYSFTANDCNIDIFAGNVTPDNKNGYYLIKDQMYIVSIYKNGTNAKIGTLTVSYEGTSNGYAPVNITQTEGGTVIYDYLNESGVAVYAIPDEGYTFVHWEYKNEYGYGTDDQISTAIIGPASIKAVFAIKEYTVSFADANGSVIQRSQVKHGDMPQYSGEPPVKQSSDPNVKYAFAGWSKPFAPVTEDVIYRAVFEEHHLVTLSVATTYGNVQITPDTDLFTGDTVTLTAEKIDDCSFLGWYIGNNRVCDTLIYRFVITENTELEAKYSTSAKASVNVKTVNGAKFTFGDGLYYSERTVSIKTGSEMTLTAQDEDKVLHWVNASGKVLGRGATLNIRVVDNMTVTLVYKSEGVDQSYVQFVSSSGQVLSAGLYMNTDTVEFPAPPTKLGYRFEKWVIDGTDTEVMEDNIRSFFADNKVLSVVPYYSGPYGTHSITVVFDGVTRDNEIYGPYTTGSAVTLKAPDISGYTFVRWKDETGRTLSFKTSYYVQLMNDNNVYAEYAYGADQQQITPVITLSSLTAITEGTTKKLTASATRSIPDDYKLVEHGILYARDVDGLDENTFVYGTLGVGRYISEKTANNGVVKLNIKVADENVAVSVRGYMIVEKDGVRDIYYTDIVTGTYAGLNH
ncbi:MAG: leucine-rich repeat domain-containing protein [Clostridia bacterium]|nr:leucine-rich repeat domain-containing protein [Clostridia bacterium]